MGAHRYVPPFPRDRLEALKLALLDHLNAGVIEQCKPLSERATKELLRLIETLIYGPPKVSRSPDVRAVAVAADIIDLFEVRDKKDAVEAAFNDASRDVDSLVRQYDRILPTLAKGERPVVASYDDVIRAYKRTRQYKAVALAGQKNAKKLSLHAKK
jgi:hypothetical protein